MPLPATDTELTPAPDSSSRQPPLSLLVTLTGSPFTDICVVRSPATVAKAGGSAPSPTFSKKALPFSAAMDQSPVGSNRCTGIRHDFACASDRARRRVHAAAQSQCRARCADPLPLGDGEGGPEREDGAGRFRDQGER